MCLQISNDEDYNGWRREKRRGGGRGEEEEHVTKNISCSEHLTKSGEHVTQNIISLTLAVNTLPKTLFVLLLHSEHVNKTVNSLTFA